MFTRIAEKRKKRLAPNADIRINLDPSKLATVDQNTLYSNLHFTNWARLTEKSRLMLLQEIENRQAILDGRPPVQVVAMDMKDPWINGRHMYSKKGETIIINRKFLGDRITSCGAAQALETLLHEGRHAFQCQCVLNDSQKVSSLQKLAWFAIQLTYADGKDDYLLYAIQNIEMDSRLFARQQLNEICDFFDAIGKPDWNFDNQLIRSRMKEERLIAMVREEMTLEKIDEYEEYVLNRLRLELPDTDLTGVSLFDHVRFILMHPEIDNLQEMQEMLDRQAEDQLNLKDGDQFNLRDHEQLFLREDSRLSVMNGASLGLGA